MLIISVEDILHCASGVLFFLDYGREALIRGPSVTRELIRVAFVSSSGSTCSGAPWITQIRRSLIPAPAMQADMI